MMVFGGTFAHEMVSLDFKIVTSSQQTLKQNSKKNMSCLGDIILMLKMKRKSR